MSMELIKSSTTDLLFVAKLGFFSFFADSFKPLLTAYQTDSPMVPFLYTDIFRLLKNVYSVIVKPDVIAKCGTAAQLKEIDLNKKENMLSTKHINVGFVASKLIEKLIRQDQVKKDVIYLFKNNVKTFVVATIDKIMERSPVGSIIVRNANVFGPKTIIELKDLELINRFKVLTSHLISLKWFDGPYGDKVMGQYRLLENEVKDKKEKFQEV